jgi:hypothetical protein
LLITASSSFLNILESENYWFWVFGGKAFFETKIRIKELRVLVISKTSKN